MTVPVYQIVFYLYSALLIGSALMVVTLRHPVRCVLFMVVAFFSSAVLWMMLQAEFLALVLIFVYVGAVMTLFLFVVMMINVDLSALREGFVKWLPFVLLIVILLMAVMLMVFNHHHLNFSTITLIHRPLDYSNTKVMGTELFTHQLYALEIAAAILLVAMVSAIGLAFNGRKENTKSQRISVQHRRQPEDGLRMVDLKRQPGEGE